MVARISVAESHACGYIAALDLLSELERLAAGDALAAAHASRNLARHLAQREDIDLRVIALYESRAMCGQAV